MILSARPHHLDHHVAVVWGLAYSYDSKCEVSNGITLLNQPRKRSPTKSDPNPAPGCFQDLLCHAPALYRVPPATPSPVPLGAIRLYRCQPPPLYARAPPRLYLCRATASYRYAAASRALACDRTAHFYQVPPPRLTAVPPAPPPYGYVLPATPHNRWPPPASTVRRTVLHR
ncbi:PREDICTED: extensin-like, partial [Priapulus caudatus]|uniref:Extensin-like n=1 Tax=Priapulus caudatus TaxID=37621 RepID=A0ABM1F5P5_PRICU